MHPTPHLNKDSKIFMMTEHALGRSLISWIPYYLMTVNESDKQESMAAVIACLGAKGKRPLSVFVPVTLFRITTCNFELLVTS